ncbi:Lpg1974 family pore-forming outer membrane protein [Legionella busanensis]|uniref:Lpg1974 family pore-forming outer membrane protein n=1 Tax=Legionella busanensis TaxID=190655 RepID=UPI00104195BB|nr:Lpg1974 family pore-forming outer membrane protein [Legionella busanensis]
MKKIVLSLLALSSGVAIAGTMGPVCVPGNVTVPCESVGFDVGIHALYLRPAFNGNQYADNFLGYNTNGTFLDKHDDWLWGFKLEGSYHFSTGSDITASWYHLRDDIVTSGNTYDSLVTGSTLSFAYNRDTYTWDAVNVEFGQHADFGMFKDVRFHAGIQYVNIKLQEYAPVTITTTDGDVIPNYNDTTQKFKGVGPRVGMDLAYNFNDAFNIYGRLAGALLIGDVDSLDKSGGTLPFFNSSSTTIVPEFDVKLGVAYTYNMPTSKLIVDGGYMATNYFEALTLVSGGVTPSTSYGFHGPYFGVKYIGMMI